MLSADYQQFSISDTGISSVGERMQKKLHALSLSGVSFADRTVLDVGCDHGFWCFLAAQEGATSVLGVDRGRNVRGEGFVDLADRNLSTSRHPLYETVDFERFEAGRNWWDLGPFNLVLLMSLYHHIYQNTGGDHRSIWYWLWRQTNDELLWENPTDARDSVVQANVDKSFHGDYTRESILKAASEWFALEYAGPAEHEPYREVWRLRRKEVPGFRYSGSAVDGAGGATKAFNYDSGRRKSEICDALGYMPIPGSMNVILSSPFDWDSKYYRTPLRDVVDRSKGLDSAWSERWARFYPVIANGIIAHALRFEGESYPDNFIELVADRRLRDALDGDKVEIWR
jgi:hypothetical protein